MHRARNPPRLGAGVPVIFLLFLVSQPPRGVRFRGVQKEPDFGGVRLQEFGSSFSEEFEEFDFRSSSFPEEFEEFDFRSSS